MKQKRKNKPRGITPEFLRGKLLKFPGGEIISKGLSDIRNHRFKSNEALAVYTASPRLNELGFHVNENFFVYPHLILYDKLKKKYDNAAHSQYNNLMRRVAKFCNHYRL